MNPAIDILFEDNHLLVVNKPAGLATMGTGNSQSVHGWACRYIRQRYGKPGKVFLGVVHRLDAATSGALVLARTSKSASRLSQQFRKQGAGPEKIYLAVVAGKLHEPRGVLRDRLRKDEANHRMRVVRGDAVTSDRDSAREAAILDYRVLREGPDLPHSAASGGYSLVAVRLRTGRKHQIRVQFASRGHIVWGDTKYGDRLHRLTGPDAVGIALHAASLTIQHPVGRQRIAFQCQPPALWGLFLPTPAEWNAALAPWDMGDSGRATGDPGSED